MGIPEIPGSVFRPDCPKKSPLCRKRACEATCPAIASATAEAAQLKHSFDVKQKPPCRKRACEAACPAIASATAEAAQLKHPFEVKQKPPCRKQAKRS